MTSKNLPPLPEELSKKTSAMAKKLLIDTEIDYCIEKYIRKRVIEKIAGMKIEEIKAIVKESLDEICDSNKDLDIF